MNNIQNQFQVPDLTSPVQKRKIGTLITVVVGILVLGVLGVGASLYTHAWDPVWNPFRPDPEDIVEQMIQNMAEVKTMHSEATFDIIAEIATFGVFTVSIKIRSDSDVTDPDNPRVAASFDITITLDSEEALAFGGEVRTTGQTSYFQLNSVLVPEESQEALQSTFALIGIDLNTIGEQWIRFDKETLGSFGIDTSELEISQEKQKEFAERIKKLFQEKKLYIVKEELPDQKIGEMKAYHYVLALDQQELKNAIVELFSVMAESSGESFGGELGISFLIGGLSESLNVFLDKVGGITGEVLIGKKDKLLYNMKVEKEIDLSQLDNTTQGTVTIAVNLEYSQFNQPVTIEAPASFVKFEELFGPLLQGLLPPNFGAY